MAIKWLNEKDQYPVSKLCGCVKICRSAYYKWLKRTPSRRQIENEKVVEWIKELYEEQNGILGTGQMTIAVNRNHNKQYNHKRIYRLMSILGLKSVCRPKRKNYIPSTPEVTAENILNREFFADKPNEKWLTDVTEFKIMTGYKLYLSAVLDLADKRIVAYKIGSSNNNGLVFDTFDEAILLNPNAHGLFHSDRGFQYTSKKFKAKLDAQKMTQSMSRVGRCIDNGPMEAFWGMLKSEMFYLRKFENAKILEDAIHEYIYFYNNRRYQKRLDCMTPSDYYKKLAA